MERSRVELPEDERKAIEDARRGAKPRPYAARKTPLGEQEKERIKAFDAAKNSVVQITASIFEFRYGIPQEGQSSGTGVVWDESGHIVTNYHLVSRGGRHESPAPGAMLVVRTAGGAEYAAKIVGAAPESDLAVMKVDAPMKGLAPIPLGSSSGLAVGQAVLALGNPLGYDHSLTSGIISALDRSIASPANTPINGIIQTDAAINPGNSGGPLLNCKGQMIGLNMASTSPSGYSAGLNYAIPSQTVIKEVAKLLGAQREAAAPPPLSAKELAIASAFSRARHSVVGVHTKERYRDFWTGAVMVDPIGSGSGVVWDKQGHVVTNFHVVAVRGPAQDPLRAADIITVTVGGKEEIAASLVGAYPDIDIAVLKLASVPKSLSPMPLGATMGLKAGQSALALGNPFGIGQTLTGGIISALGRTIDSPTGKPIKGVVQTDAAINPGNSGGPLLDLSGRLLGINTMILSATGANANVGFAVPVELICREIEYLSNNGAGAEAFLPPPAQEDKNRADIFSKAADSVVFVHSMDKGRLFASGTGFVWDDRGHIVTAYLTAYSTLFRQDPATGQISEAEEIRVTLADGNTYRARIVGRSLEHKIAVLRVFAPFKDLRPLPLAQPSEIKVGQDLFAIGNPFGQDYSLSAGVLSASRDLTSSLRGVIQTDATINPGNIGGPILDSVGRLVGMGFDIEGPRSHSGVNFAISSGTLNRIVPLLLAKGQVERPLLGFVSVRDEDALYYFRVEKGVLVREVEPGTPASRAGLMGLRPSKTGMGAEIGDIIVGLRGKAVQNSEALWDMIEQEPAGAPLAFDVLRDGKRIKVVVRPG
jgi:S1-C subfamily serine protease